MWNIGEENVKFKGQMTGYGPAGTEVPSVEKRNFSHSTGRSDKPFLVESSGKGENNFPVGNRISDDILSLYRGNLGHGLQGVSGEMISQHKLHMAKTQQGVDMFTDKDLQFAKPNTLLSQYGSHQFHDPNNFPTSLQTKGVNFQRHGLNNLESMFHRTEPSSQSNTSVGEYPQLHNSLPLMYDLSSQADAGKFLSYASEGAVSREEIWADFNSKHILNPAIRNLPPLNNASFGPINPSHGSEKSSEFSQSGVQKTEWGSPEAKFDGRNFSGNGTSAETVKDGYHVYMAGIPNVALTMTAPTQTFTVMERNQSHGSQYYPKFGGQSSCYPWGSAGASFNAKDQQRNESGMQERPSDCKTTLLDYATLNVNSNVAHASNKADGSDGGNENKSLKEEASREIGISVNKPAALGEKKPSLGMDSTSKLPSIKVTPRVAEKLWDGTLQLNTSTVVSAVAVFKSGEKVSEVNWSKFVEIKGKVRLEAFEKFVQELPRSRTRALMVISIYWKVGSSETGLMGIKEVAKGYKEGQRVGYAQLCPGIDLYVCPRSDAIITILAKYGFFKGMAAVEEDQDSLIGCVIWRRNHPSSDSAFKRSDKNEFPSLEQPLDSPENGFSNNADQNSLVTRTMDFGSNQLTTGLEVPAGASSPLKPSATGNENTDEIKNMKSTNVTINVMSNNNDAAPVLTTLPTNISSVIPQLSMSVQKLDTSAENMNKCTSHTTTPFGHYEAQRKLQVGLEPLQVLSGASQKLEDSHQRSTDKDDDDLPEFDFGNVYGVTQLPESRPLSSNRNHHPLEFPAHNRELPVDVDKSPSVPMPLELPNVSLPKPHDALHRPHAPPCFGLMQNPNQKVSLSKEVGVLAHGGQSSVQTIEPSTARGGSETGKNLASTASKSFFAQKMLETIGPASKSAASEMQKSASQAAQSSFVQRRPIWDDDDDMPEWCPPNLDNGQYLPPMSVLSRLPLSSPPLLQPRPPTTSRSPAPSPFLAPPSASTPSWSSMPPSPRPPFSLQHNQKISHQHQSGILGGRPLDRNPKTPMETRPSTRIGRSDWSASPESNPSQAKRQRRVSGWDVKPWEVKPDMRHGQSERY